MAKINILPPEIFNRIAAGEVVERPASVVKELVENAIDAGATQIKVRVEQAGTKLISVTDNGSGMDEEDALLCLHPHGTSKIATVEDIDRIATLGFRGEALPSIASVSQFQLRTRRHDAANGFEVTATGGNILHSGPCGCAPGTEIVVRDLFFNTPARRKFLKSHSTEESYIEEILIACALGNLGISFELTINGRRVFFSAVTDTIIPRLRDLLGRKTADHMLPVYAESGAIKVTGVIAEPGLTRSSRREQRSFVNGRPVEAQAIYRGIRDGYGTLNERGRYSPVVLFLEMPFSDFDINVHPAKRDVRFRQEYKVSHAVTLAISAALNSVPPPDSDLDAHVSLNAILHASQISYTVTEKEQPALMAESRFDYTPPETAQFTPPPAETLYRETVATPNITTPATPSATVSAMEVPEPIVVDSPPSAPPVELPPSRQYLGAADNTYLLFYNATAGQLEIIDQHAAHERVLYEQLLDQSTAKKVMLQPLLIPRMLEMGRPVAGWLAQNEEMLSEIGFELAPLSSNTLMLNAVPALLPEAAWEEVLLDIYQSAREAAPDDPRPALERAAAAACHAAVKAHDRLTGKEVAALIEQLAACRRPDICPHGRPTTIAITKKELEKRFGRK